MEEYHIITLNTSTLGHNLINSSSTATATASSATATSTSSGLGSWFSSLADNVTSTIEGDLQSIENDVADKLASKLGIKQWYSLHVMDMCEGTYAPNATAKKAHYNTSSCSNMTAMYHFNPTAEINKELQKSGLDINITSIDWPYKIQKGLNELNDALDAMFVLYCIGIGAAGLAILTALVAVFLSGSRLVSLGNWGLTSLSFVALAIASIIVTVAEVKAAHIINKYGNDIGVYAYKGGRYLALTWASVALMLVASCAWVAEFCVGRRNARREWSEKPSGGAFHLRRGV